MRDFAPHALAARRCKFVDGMFGREWVRLADLGAILEHVGAEEFLARSSGPYLLEIPLEEGEPAQAGPLEEDTESLAALYGGKPKIPEPTKVIRVDESGLPELDTPTVSIEQLLRRRRKSEEPRVLYLGGHPRTTVGRSSKADIRIEGRAVSRIHGVIQRQTGGAWSLSDLGSSNGTLVNGRPLSPQKPAALQPEQIVQFGDWRCAILFPRKLWDMLQRTSRPAS